VNDLEKLIRQFQGSDYFEEQPETQDPTWVYPFIPVALALLGWGVWMMFS
jgi:hypothetical protein